MSQPDAPPMSWWVVGSEHTLSQQVPAPPAAVRDFYVDLDNLRLVHPLIVAVQTLFRGQTPDGYLHRYRVTDRIPLGPLALRINYRAQLLVRADGVVLTEADQSPGVRLRGTVSFAPAAAGTRITERIRIAAPRPLAPMTVRQAVKAHTAMLAGIRSHFANPVER
ncbi:polyketide cyclase / dehydrase and lipid transport family protein [Mycobacterium sp. MAC_011194_8550]|uniref:SRPBCC family protein n=1 Tax=unclassified Mycobacterium avium complex (MAC) TaxID=2750822 RepID=UPI00044F4462|nr:MULTISPECIES: SRPBCC family protein [unclassified Mycobacterium avium complex (MAC)]ETZ57476.1 polyketide cyclase / dehydrase and lipid transport family protein [Mycobacterium sp. MAC_011194_8550]